MIGKFYTMDITMHTKLEKSVEFWLILCYFFLSIRWLPCTGQFKVTVLKWWNAFLTNMLMSTFRMIMK